MVSNVREIVSQPEWLKTRRELLTREKDLTRALDALNSDRRRLPMVRIEKDYTFAGPSGTVHLVDLFQGRRQLILQHFMLAPSQRGDLCGGCSAMVATLSEDVLDQLRKRDTAFVAVSRAPFEEINATKIAQGWSFPWYSSSGSDFNYDFHATLDPEKAPAFFNFRDAQELRETGFEWMLDFKGEQPGISCFLRDGDDVYHTYSTFGRGIEAMMTGYHLLDLTPMGRQEVWEEPTGVAPVTFPADAGYPTESVEVSSQSSGHCCG